MIKINSISNSQSQWFKISFKSKVYKRKLLRLPGPDFYFSFFKDSCFIKFLIKHFVNSYQFFWGYQRSLNYYSKILCDQGFTLKKIIKHDHQSLMIFENN